MKGITLKELREEWLLYNHEAEFRYKNKEYVLQPEAGEGKMYLVIWNCTEGEGVGCTPGLL